MNPFFSRIEDRVPSWLDAAGPDADIVVSTRARLSRNLWAFPFPGRASDVELQTVRGELHRKGQADPRFAGGHFLAFESLDAGELRCLQEMNLAGLSAAHHVQGRGLVLSAGLDSCLVINDEDHLRLVAFAPGFAPAPALEAALQMDRELEGEVEFAFNPELGYLCACPTNVGTALRMSALLHLPGLVLAGEIEKLLNALRQLQFAVQGVFGRGSTVRGALFQVSNLVTLGRSEEEVAEDFATHVGKIVNYERFARRQLYERDPLGLQDMAQRSLAVLRQARLMSTQEAFDLLSSVRLGAGLGILPGLELGRLNLVLSRQQSSHLELAAGRSLASREKLSARADLLRGWFAG